jgi:hypothetical protein
MAAGYENDELWQIYMFIFLKQVLKLENAHIGSEI